LFTTDPSVPSWFQFSCSAVVVDPVVTVRLVTSPAASNVKDDDPGAAPVLVVEVSVSGWPLPLPHDADGGAVTVTFTVTPAGSSTQLISQAETATSGIAISLPITSAQIQGWHSDGTTTAYAYSWYASTSDGLLDNTSGTFTGSKAHPCLFTYDPTAPPAPAIAPPATGTDGSVGTLGTSYQFKFANCSAVLDNSTATCAGNPPVKYEYQVNDGAMQTISVTGQTQQVSIPLSRIGENTITVTGLSAGGNASQSFTTPAYSVDPPQHAYTDGDYTGAGNPGLLTVGDGTGTTDKPGLWLAESDGAGNLSTPIDIGARGLSTSTSLSPADWSGAEVLHGNFSGNGVEDVAAYFPPLPDDASSTTTPSNPLINTGTLQMIHGPGTAASLVPESGTTGTLSGYSLDDYAWNSNYSNEAPIDLAAAGYADGETSGLPDLIGIQGDGSGHYEVALYPVNALDFGSVYGSTAIGNGGTLPAATSSPWGPDWTLQVAQPAGKPVLLALDKANGQLWESASNPANGPSGLIGMSGSTWTLISTATTSAPNGVWQAGTGPTLVQADVNKAGDIELWTMSGGTATAYTLASGATSLTQEAPPQTLSNPGGHAYPFSDGAAQEAASTGTVTLDDTESDTNATVSSSGVCFTSTSTCPDADPVLGPVAELTGTGDGSITLAPGILQGTTSAHAALQSMTLTMRFRAAPGSMGILAGTSTAPLSSPAASSAPIMYIGTDGRLYAQFPSGHPSTTGQIGEDITPMVSPVPVDDDMWHTATLVADGTSHDQVLYLDGDMPVHLDDNGWIDTANTKALGATYNPPQVINPGQQATGGTYGTDQVTIGAGVFSPDGWLNADATNGAEGTTRASYFTGDITDVALYPQVLTVAQLPGNTPQPVTTAVSSAVNSSYCMDNTASAAANANKVQIYQCNGNGNQQWTFQPDGTIHWAGNTGYCLAVTSNATTSGTPIELWSCNGQGGQQWQVLSTGEIMNPNSGMCLDDTGSSTTNGTQLQIYYCSGRPSGTWSTQARPAETAPVGTIVGNATGHCVSNAGGSSSSIGSTANGNHIEADTCAGLLSQQWTFNPNGTITVDGYCIDNTSSATTNGNPIQLHACNGGGAQVWSHPDNGTIYNGAAKMCIEDSNSNTGVQLVLETCTYNANQTWAYPDTYNR
jgi:hypothetical protein